MGFFSKKVFEHVWSKKEVNLEQLKLALEGEKASYANDEILKVSKKYLKFEKRGVSNLYLIKETDDDGVVSAVYAYSITDGYIEEQMLEMIREAAMSNLSAGEMRSEAYEQKTNEWWETDVESVTKRVEKNKPDGFTDLLVAELAPKGIIITERQVRKSKHVEELECSAVAWGVKESGLRSGIKSRFIHNQSL